MEKNVLYSQKAQEIAGKIPGATVCMGKEHSQLTESGDFLRHRESFLAFYDLLRAKKEAGEMNADALVVGIGRFNEALGYLSIYYQVFGNFEGLNLELVDILDKEHFEQVIQKETVFDLGTFDGKTLKRPFGFISKTVDFDDTGHARVKEEVKRELLTRLATAHFETSISNEADLQRENLLLKPYDFIACQNVLGYISSWRREGSIKHLVDMAKPGAIIALKTDSNDHLVGLIIETSGMPFVPVNAKKTIYRKLLIDEHLDDFPPLGFITEEEERRAVEQMNLANKGNVFGI